MFERMFDPWAITIEHSIPVHLVPLQRLAGCTDGTRIWLDTRLTAAEARCTLTHELVHMRRGHAGAQAPAVEASVREETARLLVPWSVLMGYRYAQITLEDLAHELHTTTAVIADRMRYASAEELCAFRAQG